MSSTREDVSEVLTTVADTVKHAGETAGAAVGAAVGTAVETAGSAVGTAGSAVESAVATAIDSAKKRASDARKVSSKKADKASRRAIKARAKALESAKDARGALVAKTATSRTRGRRKWIAIVAVVAASGIVVRKFLRSSDSILEEKNPPPAPDFSPKSTADAAGPSTNGASAAPKPAETAPSDYLKDPE